MDIIIEDGSHTFDANVSFLEGSLPHLRGGGFYAVEDIVLKWADAWYDKLENDWVKRYPDCEFAFVVVPNPLNRLFDNNLLVVRRLEA